jgi:hypothetical protein
VAKSRQDKDRLVAARAHQCVIGRELRKIYDELAQEPVPDDFVVLLKKIDEAKDKEVKHTSPSNPR